MTEALGPACTLLGAWCSIRAARPFFPVSVAATGAGLVVAGSFLLWYALVEPAAPHAPTFAVVAAFVWCWTATMGRRTPVHWLGLGVLAVAAGLIRGPNALVALLPMAEALTVWWQAGRGPDRPVPRAVLLGAAALAAVAGLASVPHASDVLFASRNGLFAMSPILSVAAGGLVLLAWNQAAVGVPSLITLAAAVVVQAGHAEWWGGAGFAGRRFDGMLPLFTLGAAAAADALARTIARRPRLVGAALFTAAAIWNVTLLAGVREGRIPLGEPISFGDAGATQARALHAWIGHPFSYPANLWFALRHGVSPAHYDRPATSFMGDGLRPSGRIDVGGDDRPYLLGGWSTPERVGGLTFRWALRQAALNVPLAFAADVELQLRVRGAPPSGAPQTLTIDVGGARFGPMAVGSEWQTLALAVPRSAWRAGPNEIALTFARVGSSPTGGHDVAAAVDFVRVARHD